MTANEIREAIARDKARDDLQSTMYDEKVRDMRIGRDAGIREATEYWKSRVEFLYPYVRSHLEFEIREALGS